MPPKDYDLGKYICYFNGKPIDGSEVATIVPALEPDETSTTAIDLNTGKEIEVDNEDIIFLHNACKDLSFSYEVNIESPDSSVAESEYKEVKE